MDGPDFALEPFHPAWWLLGPHAQTIGGRFLRGDPRVETVRERLELADGDFVDLDFLTADGPADRPIALVLHGLEGGSSSPYVVHTLYELDQRGVRGIAMNFRSCSGEMNRSAVSYHAGETGDLASVLGHLRAGFPAAPVAVIGFSLGGNVLLKHLGELGERAGNVLHAAAAVSVPFDLAAGAETLERGFARIYASYFMRKLSAKAAAKAEQLPAACDLARIRAARTIREFDEAATAPLHGFRDAAEYYERSSSARYLARIRVPTLIVHALDDPFLPSRFVPTAAIRDNPSLVSAVTARGGHVGFVSGSPRAPRFWAERQAARFVAAHLHHTR